MPEDYQKYLKWDGNRKHIISNRAEIMCFFHAFNYSVYSTLRLFFPSICFHGVNKHKKSGSQNRCPNSPNSRKYLVSYTFQFKSAMLIRCESKLSSLMHGSLLTRDINTTVSMWLDWIG